MSKAYSTTPLAKKLGMKSNFRVIIHQPPEHYWQLFSDLPDGLIIENSPEPQSPIDFIHLFFTDFANLQTMVPKFIRLMKKDGLLWISWPKGSSKIPTDLKRDLIREHLLDIGLVDVKVAAIDQNWSGLKFVYRVEDR